MVDSGILQQFRRQQGDIADDVSAFQQFIGFSRFQDGKLFSNDRFYFAFFQQLEEFCPVFLEQPAIYSMRSISLQRLSIRQQVEQNELRQKNKKCEKFCGAS